jgi:hypothetical protein
MGNTEQVSFVTGKINCKYANNLLQIETYGKRIVEGDNYKVFAAIITPRQAYVETYMNTHKGIWVNCYSPIVPVINTDFLDFQRE